MYGDSIWDDIRWQIKYGSGLSKLILINIAVFIAINLAKLVLFFAQVNGVEITSWVALYAAPIQLLHKPWGLITYMFVHGDGPGLQSFWHILWNMIGLYWFGQILQDMIGKPKIVPLYLYGGIAGGLLYVIAYNLIPVFGGQLAGAHCIGASGSVMAIVLAAATIAPNYELILFLIGPVKIKWIAFAYVVLDIINIQNGNAGGHIAHLGGALFGFIYIRQLQNGNDLGKIFYVISDFFSNLFKRKPKLKIKYRKQYATAYSQKQQNQKPGNVADEQDSIDKQEKLDAILDKINRSSYDSLSKEEKDFLFRISQEKD